MDKRHILEEIKRTARANGGKPLGKERFYQETGINESDWLGKHWARWGDAVRESGLEPNRMQGALDEHDLIEKFVGLMRELGKFPTANEVKLKARRTPGFPWHNTFTRFGSKHEFAARIQEYCRERVGYDDVVTLCTAIEAPDPLPADDDVEPEENYGFVYLMKSGRYYKIGRTGHVGGRERDLAIQMPDKLNTVHFIRTDDPVGIEAYWHNRFDTNRKNGEWFDLTSADVKAFKRRKFM
ncbi:MAG TPA: GIY-YIG nuclease family protein [Bryobacteraceae bacterium]|nr:GIY-YIG nuclease family protein [Bryobacteraceae bacterium]